MYHIKHLKEHIGLKTFIPIFIRLYFIPCKLVQLVKRILPSKIYINFLLLKDNINVVNLYRHILLRLILNKRGHCVDSQQFFLCSIPLKLCNYLRCCYKSSIYSIHSLAGEVIAYVIRKEKSFNFFLRLSFSSLSLWFGRIMSINIMLSNAWNIAKLLYTMHLIIIVWSSNEYK